MTRCCGAAGVQALRAVYINQRVFITPDGFGRRCPQRCRHVATFRYSLLVSIPAEPGMYRGVM